MVRRSQRVSFIHSSYEATIWKYWTRPQNPLYSPPTSVCASRRRFSSLATLGGSEQRTSMNIDSLFDYVREELPERERADVRRQQPELLNKTEPLVKNPQAQIIELRNRPPKTIFNPRQGRKRDQQAISPHVSSLAVGTLESSLGARYSAKQPANGSSMPLRLCSPLLSRTSTFNTQTDS
jgi:hypothetical protein